MHCSFEEKRAHFFWTRSLAQEHLHLVTHKDLMPHTHFPSMTNTLEHFPTSRMNPRWEEKCRPCLGQHAFLEAYCSHPQPSPPWGSENLNAHWAAALQADILPSWEWTGKRAPGQACMNSPPSSGACLSGFLSTDVPVDCIMRRDLFVEGSFQLYCLTQRWEGGGGKMRITLHCFPLPSQIVQI